MAMISRRDALSLGLVGGTMSMGAAVAIAQSQSTTVIGEELPSLLQDWGFVAHDSLTTGGTVGPDPSQHKHVVEAFRLLFNAPRDKTPYEVAKYFYDLRNDNVGKKYLAEWQGEANPLVVGFFTATRTVPSGDVTPWCAAFMNFCFMASGLSGTGSPLSGTFRDTEHPEFVPVQSPRVGDIAVFWKNGPDGDKGFGHVGFFEKVESGVFSILGGNQGDAISIGRYEVPKHYKKVEFRRIR